MSKYSLFCYDFDQELFVLQLYDFSSFQRWHAKIGTYTNIVGYIHT